MGRWTRTRLLLVFLTAVALLAGPVATSAPAPAEPQDEITLYFFWAEGCPHCAAAKPVLAELQRRHPRLRVSSFEVSGSTENQRRLAAMAAESGFEPTGVPVFFLGPQHWVGFNRRTTPAQLEAAVSRCLETACPDAGRAGTEVVNLPIVGEIEPAGQSLALSTVLIAAVDGVNPCSLWVLSILLALTLRTGSRRTTAVTGLVFIFVTGLVYALFIGGLFTALAVLSFAPVVRVIVAVVAAVFAAINIKDFFWFKSVVSLTIPESQKPGIYERMRKVLGSAESLPALVAATVVLAAGVSFVELACTAGFPLLWANIVAARDISTPAFVLLLGLYMLVYQLDELVIFAVALVTMRAAKLQERHGRVLKLLSGMLMLSLAVVLLVNPSMLNEVRSSLLVFAAAGAATATVLLLERRFRSVRRRDQGSPAPPRN